MMMISNKIMHIDSHMSIVCVLRLSKPGKQAYSNNHKHKLNTQQLELIIQTTKSLYVAITKTHYQLQIYKLKSLYKII